MSSVIVIFGANGFLGRYLTRYFTRQGKEVVAVARRSEGSSGDGLFLEWDGKSQGPWVMALEAADVVINVTGSNVKGKETVENRQKIMDSRLETTRVIGRAIAACNVAPKVWFNASNAAWYREAEDQAQDDWLGEPGVGFSSELARKWEEEFFGVPIPAETRKVALRMGMVFANEPETVFDALWNLAKCGLGGAMGAGSQRVSWIHMEDFLRALEFIIKDPFLSGALNLSAPDFPQNHKMMKIFRDAVGMPFGLPAPRWMLEMVPQFRNAERELMRQSRWAEPLRLHDEGFRWRWSRMADAVADLHVRHGLEGFFRAPSGRSVGAKVWLPAVD